MEENQHFYQETQRLLQDHYASFSLGDYSDQLDTLLGQLDTVPHTALELGSGIGLTAIGLSQRGVQVTAVDFDKTVVQIARSHNRHYGAQVDFIQADFYDLDLDRDFDLVYYLDGFGIGDDGDQVRLLEKMAGWINDGGRIYIEVYQPNHWKRAAGIEMPLPSHLVRKYSYDALTDTMIDQWRDLRTGHIYTQRLRCYSLEAFQVLAERAGLSLLDVFPNGKMDYERMEYLPQASLADCMSYGVLLA